MSRSLARVLVTGGAGFIGSNFIRCLLLDASFKGLVVNIDKLTYAGNLENLADISMQFGGSRYFFEKADLCDYERLEEIFQQYNIDTVVHFAAESHVDRSIHGPKEFIRTNILGTFNLLEAARSAWKSRNDVLFHHVSTDEVFGSLGDQGSFTEKSPYDPHSPYSASKASSDHLVRSAYFTYGLPVTISNCSNNYGPYQFPEKLIPLMILNILEEMSLPVYGDGKNIRDWLYVEDHCRAIWSIMRKGMSGDTYAVGGENEICNIDLVRLLCQKVASIQDKEPHFYDRLITFVKDRPGHDRRYAICCNKIRQELGWKRDVEFADGIERTILWYMRNRNWVERVRTGEYQGWIDLNYLRR